MEEKYDAIWPTSSETIVFENYLASTEQLEVIYQHADGSFIPYLYTKMNDPQWRLPFWSSQNEKAIMPTLESAKEYLENYVANNT